MNKLTSSLGAILVLFVAFTIVSLSSRAESPKPVGNGWDVYQGKSITLTYGGGDALIQGNLVGTQVLSGTTYLRIEFRLMDGTSRTRLVNPQLARMIELPE